MYQSMTLVGNLGGNPEMRYMPDGQAVCNFSVATNRSWNNRQTGEREDETTWFRVSVWGNQAEHCHKYLGRGDKVLVEGRLRPDPATGGPKLFTRQDGTVGAAYEVNSSTVRFLSTKEESQANRDTPQSNGTNRATPVAAGGPGRQTVVEEDEIPF